ncbi:exodeoxyribonuclease V subunit beta [Xenophilus arseniciresistens]|uniref:RecBCD enzyme subunit RecB n=1 Tax=Xenophilus arseniciresistens TaxID=1283306 RepID=A0AAE3T0N0_9BURK|nr:exodeoxyribonuclease V subunit beta [Xenophilus arseniciresistens]MDA7418382.1 exodeoxyribonuclease V subunit beta [Xenophilus arseniciresistens]
MSTVQTLDPLRFPLHGQRLIEASAGTGKTFTIALLYLRLVLGHGGDAAAPRALTPPEILVVTFTEAATQELRERIRARLDQAARVFADEAQEPDALLLALRADHPREQWAACAHRLRVAAQWMDEAAVATIHGWCWRMLREHAFDSGSLLQQQLQTDLRALQRQVLHDHWRRHFYPLNAMASRALLSCFKTPEALWQAVQPLLRRADAALRHQGAPLDVGSDPLAQLQALGAAQQQAEALEDEARRLWRQDRAALEQLWWAARAQLNGNSYRGKDDDAIFASWLQALADWSAGGEAPEKVARFGAAGARLKKGHALPDHPALHAIDAWQAAQSGTVDDALRARLLAHAAREIAAALAQEKARRAELGFDDLLQQLDSALHRRGGEALAARIRTQFPVALIDEFQDTDPTQYRIFKRIYDPPPPPLAEGRGEDSALIMIGDPKQAIYAFRGADIRTYLRARRDTQGSHYALGTNFRSTDAVVHAVNALFLRAEQGPRGAFRFRSDDGDDPVPFVPVQAQGRREHLQIDGQSAPALTLWSQLPEEGEAVGMGVYRAQQAEVAASEVVRWLAGAAEGRTGFVEAHKPFKPLRPADIAVLVRSRTEAQAIRDALSARGLRSVYLSDRESVFGTPEAADLQHWLRACAEPADEALLRTALATRTLGLSLQALHRLREDEAAWEEVALRFRELHALWQRRGVLPMLHQLLHDFGLPARWLAQAEGGERRLTNVLHIAEWLQRRAVELDGEHALLRAFAERLADPEGEEDVLRLESDAALIQVVTIHKSKGLEYPLVLLPFIAAWRESPRQSSRALDFHDEQLDAPVIELDGKDGHAAARAAEAQLAEDMRLLYVALTRARHGLWLGVAPLCSGAGKAIALERGALGQVLSPATPLRSRAEYEAALQALASDCPAIAVQPAPAPDAARWQAPRAPATGQARRPQRRGHAPWWIASYSALVQTLEPAAMMGLPLPQADARLPEPEDAQQARALEDGAPPPPEPQAALLPAVAPAAGSVHAFPKGAEPGSFLHGLLEWCAQQGFGRVAGPGAQQQQALRDLIARRCQVRGWQAWIEPLCQWVPRWLAMTLPLHDADAGPAALATLTHYQSEMEFWLPVPGVAAQQIDALAQAHCLPGLPRPALAPTQMAGMLKGFIDLVFEHEGRWWVADYKSNWLGPDDAAYDSAALQQSLLAHRYDVQYLLYLFALHRLLATRLPDYDYERHVGGAVYLFLRGADSPTQGVFATKPPLALIEAMDELFGVVGTEAAP